MKHDDIISLLMSAIEQIAEPCPVVEEKFTTDLSTEDEADMYFNSTHRRRLIAIAARDKVKQTM